MKTLALGKLLSIGATMCALAGSAVAQTIVPVTSFSPTGWYTGYGNSGGGSSSLSLYGAIDGDGALRIQGDRTRTGFGNVFPTSTAGALGNLSALTQASFQFAVSAIGPTVLTAQAPALRVVVWDPSSGVSGRRITIIWEDGEQSTPQFVGSPTPVGSFNTPYTGDMFGPGSRVYPNTAGLGRGLFTAGGSLIPGTDSAVSIGTLLAGFGPSAAVMGVELGVGSSVGAFDGYADRVRIAFGPSNDNLYNFLQAGAVSLNASAACTNSNTINITIDLNNPSGLSIAGGQFFLQYDNTKLAYVSGAPSATFSTEIIDVGGAGTIDYACGIPFGNPAVTAASAQFATLTFNKLADVCASEALTLVSFRPRPSPLPPTRLTDSFGGSIPTTTTNLAPFTMDSVAPVIAPTSPIAVNADAPGCSASVTITPPTANDNCDGSVAVNGSRSDSQPLNAPYPAGVTTITWSATDCSGNTATSLQTVTVNASNTFNVSVELAGIPSGTFNRCITFQFFGGSCPNPDQTVDQVVTFVNGVGSATFNVPCGTYSCVTARDKRHTLRQTASLTIGMGAYSAAFTGSDALRGGNLNDDIYVDILDFGGFAGQYGVNYGTGDTTCATAYPHADISGNGVVGIEDFTFIQANFLQFNEFNCCGNYILAAPNTPGGPVTDITVAELISRGQWDAARADMNHDGRLNTTDVIQAMTNGMPRCAADFNADQAVSVQDLFDFLAAWFAGHPAADFTRDQNVSVQDMFSFLQAWFGGC